MKYFKKKFYGKIKKQIICLIAVYISYEKGIKIKMIY